MPSRTEGFGLTALEAMSAGLPILVSGNSGFGKALSCLPMGESYVINSNAPKKWAKAIAAIRQKSRTQRLEEIQRLRRSYEDRFPWERQCQALVARMWKMVYGKKLTLLRGVTIIVIITLNTVKTSSAYLISGLASVLLL